MLLNEKKNLFTKKVKNYLFMAHLTLSNFNLS